MLNSKLKLNNIEFNTTIILVQLNILKYKHYRGRLAFGILSPYFRIYLGVGPFVQESGFRSRLGLYILYKLVSCQTLIFLIILIFVPKCYLCVFVCLCLQFWLILRKLQKTPSICFKKQVTSRKICHLLYLWL